MSVIHPAMGRLLTKVDSKYTLVVVAARRARALTDGAEPQANVRSSKAVTIALEEIDGGVVGYRRSR
ncbi:MAG: DNA-directed RNA polymerase subunit omega [Bacillota bacterium]